VYLVLIWAMWTLLVVLHFVLWFRQL